MAVEKTRLGELSNKGLLLLAVVTGLVDEDEGDEEDQKEADNEEQFKPEGDLPAVNVMLAAENKTYVDRSEEKWVMPAVLDVAYYLRAHKFNDFDRRYYTEPVDEESLQFSHFPNPPLVRLHWEVNKNCEKDFYECLLYLQETVLKAVLVRSLDTNTIMNERHWEYKKDAKSVNTVEEECKRLREIDWRDADPFKGPLERFQWRVSASYFMCSFAMQELPPLIMFGERCDNHAACLDGEEPFNKDPRADDSHPYQCALYSFCPEVCCPLKAIKDAAECLDYDRNPCSWVADRNKRQCVFHREHNRGLPGMAMNMWNLTCPCEPGYEWESMYGACVDIDECSNGSDSCDSTTETCLNLQGRYACVCAWGFKNETGVCVPNTLLTSALARLHEFHHPPTPEPPRPVSLFQVVVGWITALLGVEKKHKPQTNETVTPESETLTDLNT